MTSSIQKIEAALARVQLPQGDGKSHRKGQSNVPQKGDRRPLPEGKNSRGPSCSFNLAHEFEQAALQAQAAVNLAQVKPPQFCKPLSRIGAGARTRQGRLPQTLQTSSAIAPSQPKASLSYNLAELAAEAAVEIAPAAGQLSPLSTATLKKADLDPEALPEQEASETNADIPTADRQATDESPDESPDESTRVSGVPALRPKVRPIQDSRPPGLPRSKSPKFTSHRNGSNPMLPLNLLQDIGKEVVQWQTQLKRVHDGIQALYGEGPIVNAWLESAAGVKAEAAELKAAGLKAAGLKASESEGGPGLMGQYHVCGLDKNGQVWRKVCPAEQLPLVTVAIARHQKLRQLLTQKKSLDDRLQRLSKALTMLRGGLRAY